MEASTARRLRFRVSSFVGRAQGWTTVHRPVTPMVGEEGCGGCERFSYGVEKDVVANLAEYTVRCGSLSTTYCLLGGDSDVSNTMKGLSGSVT